MRILYGVVGEGMGHATRSKVVIRHLLSRGHVVKVASAGRAADFLSRAGFSVVKAEELGIEYVDGAVSSMGTLAMNLGRLPGILATGGAAWSQFDDFRPQLVISDFDSLASMYGRTHGIPVISIDNMQAIDRCAHAPEITASPDFELTRTIVAARLPDCAHYVITSFFYPPIAKPNTTLVPPILRDAVLNARVTDGGPVLVYQTSMGDARLLETLGQFPSRQFIVYGMAPTTAAPANVTMKPFDEQGFVDDLARSSAVIANGGMSLLGEALSLGKPVYSVPVRGHFEQEMNARYVEAMGLGMMSREFNVDTLRRFLGGRFGRIARSGNGELFRVVDSLVGG